MELPDDPYAQKPVEQQVFAAYPRTHLTAEDGERIRHLAAGYFGLNWIFLFNIVWALGWTFGLMFMSTSAEASGNESQMALSGLLWILSIVLTIPVIGFLTYPSNKRIGFGKGWSSSGAILASVLMGISSAFCCGIIGYIVMQSIASSALKKYGVRSGFLGPRKKQIDERIAEINAAIAVPSQNMPR